jgi:hypothetical protein
MLGMIIFGTAFTMAVIFASICLNGMIYSKEEYNGLFSLGLLIDGIGFIIFLLLYIGSGILW